MYVYICIYIYIYTYIHVQSTGTKIKGSKTGCTVTVLTPMELVLDTLQNPVVKWVKTYNDKEHRTIYYENNMFTDWHSYNRVTLEVSLPVSCLSLSPSLSLFPLFFSLSLSLSLSRFLSLALSLSLSLPLSLSLFLSLCLSHTRMHEDTRYSRNIKIQGGEDAWDALRYRSVSAKEPLIIGLFCAKWSIKMRDPKHLRHPVAAYATKRCSVLGCVDLQNSSVNCKVVQCNAASCSVLQRVAVCCSVLQCAAACCIHQNNSVDSKVM